MRRRPSPLAAAACAAAALALAPAASPAADPALRVPAGDGGSASLAPLPPSGGVVPPTARAAARRARPPRRGGRVRAAWPHRARARPPRARLARWLARQTGPVTIRPRRRARTPETPANGLPAAPRRAAATAAAPTARAAQTTTSRLLLVRSFDLPRTDPSYASLTNFSWTYDNALAVFAFLSDGDRAPAEQLLDQLRALQRADGSLDFAYDVATGAGAGQPRAGAMAWVGLAAAAYRRQYGSTRYDGLIDGVLDHLYGLRTSDGLLKGGRDVSWVSTQHNLLTIGMLRELVAQLGTGSRAIGSWTGGELNAIQTALGSAVLSRLLVQRTSSTASFKAGLGDEAIPLDVQALGVLYLNLREDPRASQVAAFMLAGGFYVPPRSMLDGRGPFSGYRPYADSGSPGVIWTEGTFEVALALRRLGISSFSTQLAVTSLGSTTASGTVAPIGADRNTESRWGEFHTWPASAAASWLLVLSSSRQLLYAR